MKPRLTLGTLIAVALLGCCRQDPLRPLGRDELDEDIDVDEESGLVSTWPSLGLAGPVSIIDPDVERPQYSGCMSLRGLPRVLSGAGYIYQIADADMGLGVATSTGTWLVDRETASSRNLHPDSAFGVTAERGSGRLFSNTRDDSIIAFDASLVPTLIHQGEANIIDIVERGDRLYFTEGSDGRVGSMAKDGTDVVTLGRMDLAHQLAVDDSGVYAAGSMPIVNGNHFGSIIHVDPLGVARVFFDADTNPHAGDFDASAFYAPLALHIDEEAVYLSTAILPSGARSGIARIEKSTGAWSIIARIDDLFVEEIVARGSWLYFTTLPVTQQFGQLLRVPRTGGEMEVLLECPEPLRILGLVDDGLYISESTDAAVMRRLNLSAFD